MVGRSHPLRLFTKVRSAWPDDTSVHRVMVRIIPCTYIIGVRSPSPMRDVSLCGPAGHIVDIVHVQRVCAW